MRTEQTIKFDFFGILLFDLKSRLRLSIQALLFLGVMTSSLVFAETPKFSKALSQVALIETNSSQGSGILISSELDAKEFMPVIYIATNAHVVKDATHIEVSTNSWKRIASLFLLDEEYDVAILKVSSEITDSVPNIPIKKLPSIGARLYAIGAPKGLTSTITEGLYSGIRTYQGKKFIQSSAAISGGSSGGALVTTQGDILGMTTFKLKDSENLGFSIPWRTIARLFEAGKLAKNLMPIYEQSDSPEFIRWLAEIDTEGEQTLVPKITNLVTVEVLKNRGDQDRLREIHRELLVILSEFQITPKSEPRPKPKKNANVRVVCTPRSPITGELFQDMWFELNEELQTVTAGKLKNLPARYSQYQITFALPNPPKDSWQITLDRSSGKITMIPPNQQSFLTGTCKVAKEKQAF